MIKKDPYFATDIKAMKLLNIKFYDLIKELENNRLYASSKLSIMAYNCFLEELTSKLNNRRFN